MMDLDVGHYVRTGEERSKHHNAARDMIIRLATALAAGEDLDDEATKDRLAAEILADMGEQ